MFFFFFQAEDGIRDYKVTGVQTCALPIFHPRAVDHGVPLSRRGVGRRWHAARSPARALAASVRAPYAERRPLDRRRSEERRVGREWRSWWWADGCRRGW